MAQDRAAQLGEFEWEAEMLVAHQLDLVAQMERQLRAVHQTMRQIERLRSARRRVGPEPSDEQKNHTLQHLSQELNAIDQELNTQHDACLEMQRTVEKMRAQLLALKATSESPSPEPDSSNEAGA